MTGGLAPQDVERFRGVLTQRLGWQFDDAKLGFLAEVLQRRLESLRQGTEIYLTGLEAGPSSRELGALAQEITVTETYFFRNHEQFRALAEIVLPQRMAARATTRELRILSAACASGEEAYSMAIVLRDLIPDPAWQVSIRAVDLNPGALKKAARARYSAWALRETPPDIQRKWFRPDGAEMVLDAGIAGAVTFEERNLATEDAELWLPGAYDVVFCRNAIMYFAPDAARAVIARILRSLAPGGYLFLGHAETLRGVSDDFHLRHTHGTFYYERKGYSERKGGEPAVPRRTAIPPLPLVPRPAVTAAPPSYSEAWSDTIRDASRRVQALVSSHDPAGRPAAPAQQTWDLAPSLDLMRRERFGEALALVRDLPAEAGDDPDALLLEAMLLAHGAELTAAEAVCQRLLLIDELNAGAYYVLALCRESAGDRDGAAEHDRVAIYLDPAFAMPRLHSGLLARRAGNREAARRELGQALALLKREDASRLLLFGGGFNRDALIALCETALRDCGGQP